MGKVYEAIDDHWQRWIERQALFFVGTAPLSADGHVNVSPKGPISSFKVLGPRRVAYLDVVGSGAETIAHLRENGRIVVMFCAFDGPPRILRLHGRGRIVLAGAPDFEALAAHFHATDVPESRRAVILIDVERIADSCGYGVPLMSHEGEREHQDLWSRKRLDREGPLAFVEYQRAKNARSIDGLPGVEV